MGYQVGESFENMLQLMHFKDNDKDTLSIYQYILVYI